jgi:hypothetical protein
VADRLLDDQAPDAARRALDQDGGHDVTSSRTRSPLRVRG